jgi:hypothetical protein
MFTIYMIISEGVNGASPGKKILGLKLVTTNYNEAGWLRVVVRETLGRWLSSIITLGYWWALIDLRKQAWHDKAAGTIVVETTNSDQEISGDYGVLVKWLLGMGGFELLVISGVGLMTILRIGDLGTLLGGEFGTSLTLAALSMSAVVAAIQIGIGWTIRQKMIQKTELTRELLMTGQLAFIIGLMSLTFGMRVVITTLILDLAVIVNRV